MQRLDRRQFVKTLGASAVVAGAGLTGAAALGRDRGGSADADGASSATSPPSTTIPVTAGSDTATGPVAHDRRVLVVVQLNGGNDALNTVVPADGRYHDARPGIAIAESDVVTLAGSGGYGLHPSLEGLGDRWDAGRLGVVAGVGFEGAGRSHFEAMDWWWAGGPDAGPSGWLGRWLDATASEAHPMRAVGLGGSSPALRAATVFPTVVSSPAAFTFRVPRGADADLIEEAWSAMAADGGAGSAMAADGGGEPNIDGWHVAARDAAGRTTAAVELFAGLVDDGRAGSDRPVGRNGQGLTALMGTAGRLVAADLGTRVIVVTTGGYDTHANQTGTHAGLLADLAGGIDALEEELVAAGRADDVLVVTTSEFGRRVGENGSGGTDHGRAGVQFVSGSAVSGGLAGSFDLGALVDGDLAPVVDVRALYRTCLDWLGADSAEILGVDAEDLGLLAV